MKQAIFCYTNTNNIGDQIQSLAALSLLPHVDQYVNRENWNEIYDTNFQLIDPHSIHEFVVLVGNGWYILEPSAVEKLNNFVFMPFSIHTTPNVSAKIVHILKELIDTERKVYARDRYTEKQFRNANINSEFIGCLTCIMDWKKLEISITETCNREGTAYIDVNMPFDATINDSFFTHDQKHKSVKEDFQLAKNLLSKYTSYKKVITNRLHAFLPLKYLGVNVELVGHLDERKIDFVSESINTCDLKQKFLQELHYYSNAQIFTQDWTNGIKKNLCQIQNTSTCDQKMNCLEIGSFEGRSLSLIHDFFSHSESKFFAIDHWLDEYFQGTQKLSKPNQQESFLHNTKHIQNLQILRGFSHEKILDIQDDSIDFAYIDGDHSSKSVEKDAFLVWKKIKNGGIILFDDYFQKTSEFETCQGIDSFLNEYREKLEIILHNNQIAIRKLTQ